MRSPPAPSGAGGAMRPMNHYWRLSPTVTACLASGRILFLDIARDRYLALPPVHNEGFLAWLQSPGDEPPQSCLPMLAELGVCDGAMRPAPVTRFVRAPIPMDSPDLRRRRVRVGDMLSVARAVVAARAAVRSRPLAEVLARYFPTATEALLPAGDLQSRLATFRSARTLVPVRRLCLHDCLALIDWLGPSAGGVTLVLGVSALPFAAHSWLQVNDLVIDDHPESPSRYQPILHLP